MCMLHQRGLLSPSDMHTAIRRASERKVCVMRRTERISMITRTFRDVEMMMMIGENDESWLKTVLSTCMCTAIIVRP